MCSSTPESVRRPSVTTGGCSRNTTVSGIAPWETAPARARCSSKASPYGTSPRLMRYAPFVTRGRLLGANELACCIEVVRVDEDLARSASRRHRVESSRTEVRIALNRLDPGRGQQGADHLRLELVRDDRQPDDVIGHERCWNI